MDRDRGYNKLTRSGEGAAHDESTAFVWYIVQHAVMRATAGMAGATQWICGKNLDVELSLV